MDPKTTFVILLMCVVVGETIKNILSIAGLTKTVVVGGDAGTNAISIFASILVVFGSAIGLFMLFFQWAYLSKLVEFILGS